MMDNMNNRLKYILNCCFLFMLLAHGFRWFNTSFNHDSLIVFQDDGFIQLYLGRWLMPVWILIRGKIASPLIIAAFSIVFFSAAVILLTDVLGVKKKPHVALLTAVLASCPVITCLFTSFISSVDLHMLAFAFSMLSVFLMVRFRRGWIPGGFFLAMAMALYQTYLEVALVVLVFWFIREAVRGTARDTLIKSAARACLFLFLGCLLYYAGWRLSIFLLGENIVNIPFQDDYNSLTRLGDLSLTGVIPLLKDSLLSFFRYVIHPETLSNWIAGGLNVLMAICAFIRIMMEPSSPRRRLFLSLAVISLPVLSNFVYILTGGVAHTLMVMSIVILYAGCVMTLDLRQREPGGSRSLLDKVTSVVIIASLAVVSFNYTIFANQCHLKKALEEEATLSTMTRMIDRIEEVEGYIPGETKVALLGNLNKTSISQVRPGYEDDVFSEVWSRNRFSVSYPLTQPWYLSNILAYPINLLDTGQCDKYSCDPEVAEMPSFPSPGCAKMIGDVLVFKLSDTEVLNPD